jgi:TrfA protein
MSEPVATSRTGSALDRAKALAARVEGQRAGEGSEHAAPARCTDTQEEGRLQLSLGLRFEQLNESRYPMPNSFARGGLFAAVKDGKAPRAMLREKTIVTTSQYDILYTGDQLNQSDLDVLMALLTHSRERPLGELVSFTAYSILRHMKWALNAEGYQRLRESLLRLQRAQVQISVKREGRRPIKFAGSFINNFIEDDKRPICADGDNDVGRSHWTLRFDGELSRLFGDDQVTLGLWYFRRKVDGRMPLAQHLLSFYVTHKEPIPLTVAKLRELSGTTEKNESNFVIRLEKALAKLVDIGFLKSFRIINDRRTSSMNYMVHVERVDAETVARLARAERDARGRELAAPSRLAA